MISSAAAKLTLGLASFSMALLAFEPTASAWILPEHTQVTHRAFKLLSPIARQRLTADWQVVDSTAIAPHSPKMLHLCKELDTDPESISADPRDWCVGFAVLPSLAGDHSCSPSDLMKTLRVRDWVHPVLRLSNDSAEKLRNAKGSTPKRLDARRDQHLTLQILDGAYARRAKNNSAHFQLPRPAPRGSNNNNEVGLLEYVAGITKRDHKANAIAAYVYYHAVALELASEAARLRMLGTGTGAGSYDYYAQWAFFNEAFALHFLEDAFSSGHFVGTWGDVAERLGTHDYYSQHGVDAETWAGSRYAAHGDAFMTEAEIDRVGITVAASLEQLGDAFAGVAFTSPSDPVLAAHQLGYDFDVCDAPDVAPETELFATSNSMLSILANEPIPTAESPALPRFRTEIGLNIGVSVSFDAVLNAAVTTKEPAHGSGRARLGFPRVGLGVTDLLTQNEDGNWFVEGVIVGERGADGSLSGIGFRAHSPFAWIPFDGIPTSLCALFVQAPFCVQNSRRAAAGSAYGINPSRRIGPYASVGVSVLRDISLLFMNEGGLRGATRRDLLASLFTIRTGTDYSGRLTTHIGVDFGFQWRQRFGDDGQHYLGGYISLFTNTPYYIAP